VVREYKKKVYLSLRNVGILEKFGVDCKMLERVDVLIPTKDPSKVRPKLLETLRKAKWVNDIIFETSKPLSTARVIGAKKCTTEWIAMFDDDVEIPECWFDVVSSYVSTGVLAVSTPYFDDNVHLKSYQKLVDYIKPLHTRDTPFICNTLIKREILLNYNPPPTFYSEDELLYRHVKKYGKWVHPPNCGVKHYYVQKDLVKAAAIAEQLHFYPLFRFVRGRLAYFIISVLAIGYSHTWRTIPFFYKNNVKLIAGLLKTKLMK